MYKILQWEKGKGVRIIDREMPKIKVGEKKGSFWQPFNYSQITYIDLDWKEKDKEKKGVG